MLGWADGHWDGGVAGVWVIACWQAFYVYTPVDICARWRFGQIRVQLVEYIRARCERMPGGISQSSMLQLHIRCSFDEQSGQWWGQAVSHCKDRLESWHRVSFGARWEDSGVPLTLSFYLDQGVPSLKLTATALSDRSQYSRCERTGKR